MGLRDALRPPRTGGERRLAGVAVLLAQLLVLYQIFPDAPNVLAGPTLLVLVAATATASWDDAKYLLAWLVLLGAVSVVAAPVAYATSGLPAERIFHLQTAPVWTVASYPAVTATFVGFWVVVVAAAKRSLLAALPEDGAGDEDEAGDQEEDDGDASWWSSEERDPTRQPITRHQDDEYERETDEELE